MTQSDARRAGSLNHNFFAQIYPPPFLSLRKEARGGRTGKIEPAKSTVQGWRVRLVERKQRRYNNVKEVPFYCKLLLTNFKENR